MSEILIFLNQLKARQGYILLKIKGILYILFKMTHFFLGIQQLPHYVIGYEILLKTKHLLMVTSNNSCKLRKRRILSPKEL